MNRLSRNSIPFILMMACIAAFLLGNPVRGQDAKPGGAQDPVKGEEPKDIVIKAEITKADPIDARRAKCHHKVHPLKMLSGYTYVIDMKAKADKKAEFDTFLRLEDAAGNELESNDDYITTDSRITFTPKKTDEYRIIATTFDEGFTGAYTLTISSLKAGTVAAIPGVLFKVDGQLSNTDPFDPRRPTSHHKVHTFKMAPGKSYTIDMMSMAFDTYLRLEDSLGNELAADDDGGEGLNSRIVISPSKIDTYRIIATTFGSGAIGKYTLTVTAK